MLEKWVMKSSTGGNTRSFSVASVWPPPPSSFLRSCSYSDSHFSLPHAVWEKITRWTIMRRLGKHTHGHALSLSLSLSLSWGGRGCRVYRLCLVAQKAALKPHSAPVGHLKHHAENNPCNEVPQHELGLGRWKARRLCPVVSNTRDLVQKRNIKKQCSCIVVRSFSSMFFIRRPHTGKRERTQHRHVWVWDCFHQF